MGAPAAQPGESVNARYIYLVCAVAALGGLLFGFDTAVINGAIVFLKRQFALNELQTEAAASSLLFGCIAGAAVAGAFGDRFGRRATLIASAALFLLSAVGAAIPRTLTEFVIARFLGGIAIGLASTLSPIYIAEIAPARIRGRLVTLNQMAIVTGILVSYLVGWLLVGAGQHNWRWMFLSAGVPSLAFFVALFFVPESPRWLVSCDRGDEARRILTRANGPAVAAAQMTEIEEALKIEPAKITDLVRPGLRRAVLIGIVLAVASQFTGINTIIYYSSIIFTEHVGHQNAASALWANVLIGGTNFATTIIALAIIDRVRRRSLLMWVLAGMAVALGVMGAAFRLRPDAVVVILSAVLSFIAFFAIGMGPGVWLVLSEIFPTRVRGRAMSVATIALWSACALITFTFLSLVSWLGPAGAFWFYGSVCVATCIFVWTVIPETRGKTLEEIERFWTC